MPQPFFDLFALTGNLKPHTSGLMDELGRMAASTDNHQVDSLFFYFLILSAVIMALVGGAILICVIRFRSGKRPDEPRQVFGHKGLEVFWSVVPLLILVYFFVKSMGVMISMDATPRLNEKPDIEIIAHQWWWEFRLPDHQVITANELHIPVGQSLLLAIESADVVHDWWVPALGRKMDAIPGHTNWLRILAEKPGVFTGACSEYCGVQHAWMRIRVVVESPEDFAAWIKSQQAVPAPPTDEPALAGAELFQQKTCAVCHNIEGTAAQGRIGPDLTHLASRDTLLSGLESNTPKNLRAWLKNPQKIKSGANMPNFQFTPQELDALVAYLEELK